jgi:hypothetical protein
VAILLSDLNIIKQMIANRKFNDSQECGQELPDTN